MREELEMPPIFMRAQDEMEPKKARTKVLPADRAVFPISERHTECLEVAPPGSTSINKNV